MSSTTPDPDPPLPFSLRLAGAVVILLGAAFVLAVATAGAFAALHLTLPRATSSTSQTLPVGAAPALVLRGATGDVRVLAGGDGEVRVDVTRKGRALTAQRAAEYMARHAVDITQTGATVTVDSRAAGGTAAGLDRMVGSSDVYITVWVPPATAVDARLANGDLHLRWITGPVSATVVHGEVRLQAVHLSGANSISTEHGDVTVDASLGPDATLDVRVGFGDVRVVLPAATNAVLDTQVGLGEVNVEGWPLAVRDVGGGQRAAGALGAGAESAGAESIGAALRVQVRVGDARVIARDAPLARPGTAPEGSEGNLSSRRRELSRS
jgi:hypothetical protein